MTANQANTVRDRRHDILKGMTVDQLAKFFYDQIEMASLRGDLSVQFDFNMNMDRRFEPIVDRLCDYHFLISTSGNKTLISW